MIGPTRRRLSPGSPAQAERHRWPDQTRQCCSRKHHLTGCSRKATLGSMIEIRKTEVFARWLDGLRDLRARARVQVRIERLAAANRRDARTVGEGVSELRIDYGPGYRVYFTNRGATVVILLAGGDKRTQAADIRAAIRLARNL